MVKKKILLIILSLIVLGAAGAILTKLGYIPNYLDIEILCPKNKTNEDIDLFIDEKPVIYLYPTEETHINVQLDYDGKIIASYPKYNEKLKGWEVFAYPNGNIVDKENGKEYSYLFWEGQPNNEVNWNLSTGFVVKGTLTREFLREKLAFLGLTPREYNEFIVHWYPKMQNSKYNLIHFAQKQYTNKAQLTISPEPDSILRVFMVYKPLEKRVKIEEQNLKSFERKGFTVVEWGGTRTK